MLQLPVFAAGDIPKADALNIALQSWAVQLNTWVREHAYPPPVVNLSEGQAAYVKTASDVRAGQDGLLREYDEDLSGKTVMVSGKPWPKEYSCEKHATAVPCRQCDAEELSLPDWVPSGYHITQHFEGTNHAGVHPGSLEECAECSPVGPSRPEWLPGDAGKQIFDMRFRLEDNPHWKIENLITRWYNESAHGRPSFDGYVEAVRGLQEQHGRDLKRLDDARRARDDARVDRDKAIYNLEAEKEVHRTTAKERDLANQERDRVRADYDELLNDPAHISIGDGQRIARQYIQERDVAKAAAQANYEDAQLLKERLKERREERDRAAQDRDEMGSLLNATQGARDKIRQERNGAIQRAEAAEAKVARVELALKASYSPNLFQNAVVPIKAIRKALDGES